MLFAVFTWSLYPVLGALGVEKIDTITFVAWIQTLSFIAATLLAWVIMRRKGMFRNFRRIARRLDFNRIVVIIIAGICSNLAHFGLLYSLTIANKAGAYIVYESAPIISMFLIPVIVAKPWEKLRMADWVAAVMALCGVAVIILSDTIEEGSPKGLSEYASSLDIAELAGYGCALMGAITMSISDLLRAQVALVFKALKSPVVAVLLSEAFCRFAAMPVAFFASAFYAGESRFDAVNMVSMFFIGIVIYTLGSAAYTLAILYAKRPSISLSWYLMPVLSLIWLHLTGMSQIGPATMAGATLILWATFILAWRSHKPGGDEELTLTGASV